MRRRSLRVLALVALAGGALTLAVMTRPSGPPVPLPLVHVAVVDPYGWPVLAGYAAMQRALRHDDLDALRALASAADGYLAYLVHLRLARHPALDPQVRLAAYERVLELRLDDPLERAARRALHLEIGALAEAAAARERAAVAYRAALPEAAAADGLARVLDDPLQLAAAFLDARLHEGALAALGDREVPRIEAPALRALGQLEAALDAYRRWRALAPDALEAREGEAWTLFALERWDEADAAFAALGGATEAYGRGLVAGRRGAVDEGIAWLLASSGASRMWIATGWLEERTRWDEAMDAYLAIARGGDPALADDAAYRALVLAERLGDDARAAAARALVPATSYFGLRLGGTLDVPAAVAPTTLGDPAGASPAAATALELARALLIVGDPDAARGELTFALRAATAREDVVLLAEALQVQTGEFRQSQRAAQALLAAGDRDPRVWRLAYPRAFPEAVRAATHEHAVEPALVWAIMRQESAFAPFAVSTSNAQGLMQVIPSTWTWLAELLDEPPADPFDPAANVRYGATYLAWLLDLFDGDTDLVIPSYNRGQGYVQRLFEGALVAGDKDDLVRFIDALETREYLQRVGLNLAVYRGLYGADAEAP